MNWTIAGHTSTAEVIDRGTVGCVALLGLALGLAFAIGPRAWSQAAPRRIVFLDALPARRRRRPST
ncbi:MAG: hypothetical protein U5J78_03440 [Parasphingorhabdus sp.]|nr:hypothetical protein [Parasphingorhabdus sp.]